MGRSLDIEYVGEVGQVWLTRFTSSASSIGLRVLEVEEGFSIWRMACAHADAYRAPPAGQHWRRDRRSGRPNRIAVRDISCNPRLRTQRSVTSALNASVVKGGRQRPASS